MTTSTDPKVEAKSTAEAAELKKATRGKNRTADKTKQANKSKAAAEEPTPSEKEKPSAAATEGTETTASGAEAAEKHADTETGKVKKISRQELIERAFQKVKERLDSNDAVTPATIGALEKLLKLDRDILEENEMPQEIRVLWEETDDDPRDQ
jgi:hypothetical protein